MKVVEELSEKSARSPGESSHGSRRIAPANKGPQHMNWAVRGRNDRCVTTFEQDPSNGRNLFRTDVEDFQLGACCTPKCARVFHFPRGGRPRLSDTEISRRCRFGEFSTATSGWKVRVSNPRSMTSALLMSLNLQPIDNGEHIWREVRDPAKFHMHRLPPAGRRSADVTQPRSNEAPTAPACSPK